ncbi:hypothetical protein LOTGIDRAFT_159945 [Lottia gigantea]|uniref:Apple domain-containing protein n=1 Tax=Lottia gigantea TaxID=225164 RepID=V4C4P7_LOTGI|nr:hypothetical protein LOTGIDRAFT_159945 [Lottia gigantea]ESO96529.1 hypothetical protein LOTGIDRAFT_159945 [Lottia gigantea]
MLYWWTWYLYYLLFDICSGALWNLALNKPASQSSIYENCVASRSVDGIDGLDRYGLSCSHTIGFNGHESKPWWEVDLQQEYYIKGIAISHPDFPQQNPRLLHKFSIEIYGNGETLDKAVLCYYQEHHATPATTEMFTCTEAINGRYVRITVNGKPGEKKMIYVCEVRVFGSPEFLSYFVRLEGTEVGGLPIATQQVENHSQCAMKCYVLPNCIIFSVQSMPTYYQCEIYSTNFLVANSTGNANTVVFLK